MHLHVQRLPGSVPMGEPGIGIRSLFRVALDGRQELGVNVEVVREDLGCAIVVCVQEGDTLWVVVDNTVSAEFASMVISVVSTMVKLPGDGWIVREEAAEEEVPPDGEVPLTRRRPRRVSITARLGAAAGALVGVTLVGVLVLAPRWSTTESMVSLAAPTGQRHDPPPGVDRPVEPVMMPTAVLAPASQARAVIVTGEQLVTATSAVTVAPPPAKPVVQPVPCGLLCQLLGVLSGP